ncbi:serine hydrolase domain-containing protein [Chryseobacterium gregarium]|uniref:serine hydrolase domain-containing protein n=1 Tax=Chryseobacterium gregarium TaxID=456299 RepID=UPI000418B438|nr:serine hydrolase domain-containing protein [Chryseobacterium gregarium]
MNKNIILLLCFITSVTCFSQNHQKFIESAVRKQFSKFPGVGLVIGIYEGSKTRYYTYGSLQKDGKAKTDSATLFEIGSATKTFTALLLAQEINKGKINAFDFIDSYLPKEIPFGCALKKRILLTDLASHQSGLPNLSNDRYFSELMKRDPSNPFRFIDRKYLYDILKSTDSLSSFRQYQYNNYAFALLGSILADKSKISYERMVEDQILKPLHMNSTLFSVTDSKNRAGLYNQQGEPQKPMILNQANPAGGLHSNAVDLLTYLKAFLQHKDFIPLRKLTEKTYYEDTRKKIGLGWEIGNGFVEKDGDTFGNSSLIRYSPDHQVAIVVLSNHQNGKLVRDLMNEIYIEITK